MSFKVLILDYLLKKYLKLTKLFKLNERLFIYLNGVK